LAYPELWKDKLERIRKTSPFSHIPGWRIQSVIVKSGDDLRQEQLAMQLISTIHQIFMDAELSLWLYPYAVVATSSSAGLIETVPDAISLDSLKKRIPNVKSLEDYFQSVYGERSSLRFVEALRNFVESLAGYSLVCYLLQIKDRFVDKTFFFYLILVSLDIMETSSSTKMVILSTSIMVSC